MKLIFYLLIQRMVNIILNKILISDNGICKKWNISTSQLEIITTTTPTESDFINNGNEKSDLGLIPSDIWESLINHEVKIIEYTDDPSQNESICTIETEPFTFYNEMGDNFDVLYYTDNLDKTNANLEITHNYSPLDDLEGDFDLVTYIKNEDIQEVSTKINSLPIEQITIDTRDIQLYGDLSKVIVNSIDNIQINGDIKLVLSFNKGVTWNSFINNSWITIDVNSKIDFNTNGMTIEQLQNINEIDLLSKINNEDKTIRLAYYVDEYMSTSTPLQISDIKTVQKATLSSPTINNASLYILNTVSTINLSLKGNTIDGIIDDIDHGKVKYRVYLNNNPYYPANGDFTSFETTPLNIAIRIDNKDVLMDQQNTLKVEIQDYWGESDYWETTFIGTYSGLIFKDSNGEYYSNDIGEVLKYMDIGTLIAGQVSEEYEVHLYNTYGYDVKDIIITPKTDSSAVQIELSKQIEPFISESSLQWDLLSNGEGVVFYVRLATQYTTPPVKDGIFELRVNANPVDTSL